jgi:membrane protein YdbS with pleckstrin-like domain
MRGLAPNTDTVPSSVSRYLLPHERQVISVHQHPAVLIWPIFLTLIGLGVAGWLGSSVAHGNTAAVVVIWLLWGILLLRLVWKVIQWLFDYFVITSQRLLLVKGFPYRRANMMPLAKVTDMSFNRSPMGQLLGYGEFVVESAGQDQALRNVDYLPYPEQLYLEVCGLIFKETDKDDGTGTPTDAERSSEHELNRLESVMNQLETVLGRFVTDLIAATRNPGEDTDENRQSG